MKKTISLLLLTAVLLTGCGREDLHQEVRESAAPETAPVETVQRTPLRDDFVTDLCGVLTQEEADQLRPYLQMLSDSRLLNIAVVITDDLAGETPERYAADQYRERFDRTSTGFLLLINNDTGADVFHLEGACAQYMTDTDQLLIRANPALVEGRFSEALELLLTAGESMPTLVFDQTGLLSPEETAALRESAERTGCAVLLTSCSASDDAAALSAYAAKQQERCGAPVLLLADVRTSRISIPGREELAAQAQAAWEEGSLFEALELYYNAMG